MKTKLIWIMGLALLLAGCSTETFEPNNTNSCGDDISAPTKLPGTASIWMEVAGTVTFGINCPGSVQILWGNGIPSTVVEATSGMVYVSHTYPDDMAFAALNIIGEVETITELECKNSGILTASIWSDIEMNLTRLDFSDNAEFAGIDFTGDYPYLEELYLNNNDLFYFELFGTFPSLQILQCNNNKLTSLNCSSLPNLFYLDCHRNNISQLNLSGCKLGEINISYNNLTSVNFNNALHPSDQPLIIMGHNPFENSYAQSQAVANTLKYVTKGYIYLNSADAAGWFGGICGPKGWTILLDGL